MSNSVQIRIQLTIKMLIVTAKPKAIAMTGTCFCLHEELKITISIQKETGSFAIQCVPKVNKNNSNS